MRAVGKICSIPALSLLIVTLAYAATSSPTPCPPLVPQRASPRTKDTLLSDLKLPDTTPPQLVYSVGPEFPSGVSNSARRDISIVGMTVDEDGKPQQVHIVCSANPAFDSNVIKAVGQYRFKPARLKGKPVPIGVEVVVNKVPVAAAP